LQTRRSFRAAVAAVATIGVVGLLGVELRLGRETAARRVGISIKQAGASFEVEEVVPGLPAAVAGIRVGDRLLQVDGTTVGSPDGYDHITDRFGAGRPIPYRVSRGDQALTFVVQPGVRFGWADFLLGAVCSLCFLGVGLLALLQRSEDLRARLLFLFAVAVSVELALPDALLGFPTLTLVKTAVFYALTGFQIGVELHLASVIPARQRWLAGRGWVVPLYYIGGALCGASALAALVAEQVLGTQVLPWSFAQAEQFVNDICLPLWATGVTFLLGRQALRYPEPQGRQQAGLILLGALPWVGIVYGTTALTLLGIDRPDWVDSLWSPLLLCYPVAVFIAIYRYQLFDLELVLRRGLVYTALTGTLILAFYAALGAGGAMVSALVGGGARSVWLIAGATLALGMLFAPLRSFLQRSIDRTFFPERFALRERLIALADDLAARGKLPAMGKYLVGQLCEVFAVRAAALLIADPKSGLLLALASSSVDFERDFDQSFLLSPDDPGVRWLRRTRRLASLHQLKFRSASLAQRMKVFQAVLAIPLLSRDKLVGLLLTGEKESRQPYPSEEVELLNLFSHNVASVLENARLFESATYESLTGLLRREGILDQLDRELERARRYRRPLTVGMADLDHFKRINDEHGHLVGDTMLKRVAQALTAGLRTSDWIGRYGGEEFLFVLPETSLEGAVVVAEKVRELVERVRVMADDGTAVRTTVSIGLGSLAELDRDDRPTAERLIAVADRSLFRAKELGRNRIEPTRMQASG
jgi:diguanylate cyclase (GGDEF)-like protein